MALAMGWVLDDGYPPPIDLKVLVTVRLFYSTNQPTPTTPPPTERMHRLTTRKNNNTRFFPSCSS